MVYNIRNNFDDFSLVIKEETGEDINTCYQCKKCSSGCPVSHLMDYTPNQLIYFARIGLKDQILKSKTIWLCASCYACSTRCPQGIDIAKIMDTLRAIVFKSNIPAGVPEVLTFYKIGLSNIKSFGRLYEIGLITSIKLATKDYAKDLELGINMIKKGKLKLLPSFEGSDRTKKIFKNVQK